MNASERLRHAKALALDGHFAEALAEHEWFHHNALAEEPALRGVRRSFALAYWAELGQIYAPALQALTDLRNRNEAALRNGTDDSGLFADVAAINHYLQDEASTYRLFVALDERNPEFAINCFGRAVGAIVRAQDFQLARKYIPNPDAALAALMCDFNQSVAHAFQLTDKRHRALRLQAETGNFSDDVILLLSITRNTDGAATAERLIRAAISGVSSESIRRRVARKLCA